MYLDVPGRTHFNISSFAEHALLSCKQQEIETTQANAERSHFRPSYLTLPPEPMIRSAFPQRVSTARSSVRLQTLQEPRGDLPSPPTTERRKTEWQVVNRELQSLILPKPCGFLKSRE
jgi:hypothetical protein